MYLSSIGLIINSNPASYQHRSTSNALLVPVKMAMKTPILFLLVTLASTSYGAVNSMTWCTISDHEHNKCLAMKEAFSGESLTPEVVCLAGDGVTDCLAHVHAGRADLITLDGGDVYTAGQEYGLVPVIQEIYEEETYYAVAVVRATDANLSFDTLKGKKSCHTGMRRTAGWNIPVGFLLDEGYMEPKDCGDDANAVANFFSESCAPGAYTTANDPYGTNPESLCSICTNSTCPADSRELYQSYAGAFRCLAENAGDVAFIKPATVTENTDGNGMQDWNRNLTSQDFRLLCPDNTQDTIDNAAACNLAQSPAHAVVTSESRSADDIQAFQDLLQEAVDLFGDDDNSLGFALFDSSEYGGVDLLFKDTAQSLKNLASGQTYRTYLGTYADTIDGLKKCPDNTLRWCTISVDETLKCRDMSDAFEGEGITPTISCYEESNKGLCIDRIDAGDADVVTLDGGELYAGGREEKIAPVAGEVYEGTEDASYWAVAVARKGTQFGMDELEQRRSCHTGIGKTSGWNVPVGHLIDAGHIVVDGDCDVPASVGAFFSGGSCAPGAKSAKYDPLGTNPSSLCSHCIGMGNDHCVRNSAEPYYDYAGAFRCLTEQAGEVAFVKHTTVPENSDGNGKLDWNQGLLSDNYELLCVDNTRKDISEWMDCNLAKVPSHTVATAISKTSAERQEISNVLNAGQGFFSSDGGDLFKMFDSSAYGGSDLLFKDSTQNLVDVGTSDTFEKWLSDEYVADLDALYCVANGAAQLMTAASIWTTIFALIAQAYWISALASE